MSFSTVEAVHAQYPVLLTSNTEASDYQFVVHVIAALRAKGFVAYHVCKTAGEGQYVPPGFAPRTVIGLDGKGYTCTGVSHDALWCDGVIFDVIVGAAGHPMPGRPGWNPVPQEHWRPNNPPLLVDSIPPAPKPKPEAPPVKDILPKGEAYAALKALDAFYRAPEGLQRPEGLGDVEGMAQWFYQLAVERVPLDVVLTQIRNSDEWKAKHP